MTIYASDTLDFIHPLDWDRRNATLPPQHGGFVDGRRQHPAELFEANSRIVAELREPCLLHRGLGCISCNIWQVPKLHGDITRRFPLNAIVAR